MKVAIFDFDGTLYKEETFQVMMNHLKNHPTYSARYKKFIMHLLPRYIGAKLKVYPERRMQKQAMQIYINVLKDLTKNETLTYFQEVADEFTKNFNINVVSRFHNHLANNDYIMLVSGAYTPLLKLATKQFPFHKIIGTDIPFQNKDDNGSYTIDHIQGDRKTEKIHEALAGKNIDWENSSAYADSYSDLPVFNLVGHRIAVDPDEKLREHALQYDWEII